MSRVFALLSLLIVPPGLAAQDTERLYQEACDGGDLIACNVFGLMLVRGEQLPQDIARAATLYERACEGGALVGCTNLGLLHQTGSGVPLDPARAAGFYAVACEGGEQVGCALLDELAAAGPVPGERHSKSGRVGDAESTTPLANAIIELPDLEIRAISDALGRFGLSGLPAGHHRLRVEALGHDLLEATLEVPGDSQFVVLLTRSEGLIEPDAPGQILGQVTEPSGRGLSNVEVTVLGQERATTLSNQQGRFTIRDIGPGLAMVRFARLGYAPRTAALIVQPGRTAEIGVSMAVEPVALERIAVTVRSRDLERAGFYQRAERGWGSYLTPSDLEERQPVLLSDALRGRVTGVRIDQGGIDGITRLISRRGLTFGRGECVLPVYIDGVRMLGDTDIDMFPPEAIAAVEVYPGGAGTPIEYSASSCGAVLIWTRRGN